MATKTYNAQTLLVAAKPRNKRLREIGYQGGSSATVDVDLTPYLLKATFDDLFEKVNLGTEEAPKWSIKAKYGLWTEQFLSAKGVGSDTSTGGGGGIDYEALEEYLCDNLAGYLSQYAKTTDIPDVSGFLTDYDVKSISVNGGAQQPLKGSGNVDINAATSIDGSGHITAGALQSDGTIEVGVESGYSIPSNSKQQGWDAAKALLDDLFEKVNIGTDSNPQWSIKAKYGLWTEQFLSAKGVGDGSAEGISYEAVQEMIADALAGYNPSTGEVDWDSIVGKPSTFAPSAHSHTKADITDFAHGHGIADVTGLQDALAGKVPTTRTITAGAGLTGGGTLAADRTISLNATNAGLLKMLSDMFEWQTVGGVRTIKAKASLWTEGYLSAKGTSSDSSASGLTAEAVQEMIDDALVGYTPGDGIVEWTDIVGKPDVFSPASHTHSYLPLSGGTLTGNLTIGTNPIVGVGGAYMLAHKPTGGMTGVSTTQWGVGALTEQGVIRSNNTDLIHYRHGASTTATTILDSDNYSSYALPRLGTIVTDFNAETAIGIRGRIGANATNGPTDASNNAINLEWGDVITFRGSADTGMQMAYGFNNGTAGGNIFYRFGRQLESTQKEWYSWKKLLDSANYSSYALPLTGGTLTGNLTIGSNVIIGGDDQYMLGHKPTMATTGVSATQWFVGASDSQGVIRSTNTNLMHYRKGASSPSSVILDSANYTDYAVPKTRTISAGNGLSGGGDLSADRTLSAKINGDSLSVDANGLKVNIVNNTTTASTSRAISATQFKNLYDLVNSMFSVTKVNGVDTIKAKMSLWTEGYLSAKGTSNDSSASGLTAEAVQEMIDDALVGYTPGDGIVEWTDIVGKPDVFNPSSHTHSYLPLSGGTLTGSLTMNSNVVIGNSGAFMLGHKPTDATTGVSATQWFVGASDSQGVIRSNDTDLIHYRNGNATAARVILDAANYSSYALPLSGGTLTGSLSLSQTPTSYLFLRSGNVGPYLAGDSTSLSFSWHKTDNSYDKSMMSVSSNGYLTTYGNISARTGNGGAVTITGDNYTFGLHLGGGGVNRGIYDFTTGLDNWLLYFDSANTIANYGNLLPGTTHAQQLGSSSKVWEKAYLRYIDTDSGYNLRICCAGTETIIVNADNQCVGIGTTAPAYKLDVAGDTRVGGKIIIHGTNTSNDTRFITSDNASNIYFSVGGVESLIVRNDCVRRGSAATSVSSGTSIYPWNGVYATADATTANNDTGFVIPSAGRIGGNSSGGLGVYAIDSLYLRFGCGSDYSNASNGLVLSSSGSTLSSMLTVSNKININSPAGADGMIYCQLNGGTQIGFGVGTSTKRGIYDASKGWLIYTDGTSTILPTLNVGIGTTSPDAKLHVAGAVHATDNITSDKECVSKFTTSSSDERLKRVTGGVDIALRSIAEAPSIRFDWRDGSGKDAGSIAQYWQDILPEAVRTDSKGFLTMQYGKLALLSAISLARNAVGHEARIAQLEGEVERLKQEVERLSA